MSARLHRQHKSPVANAMGLYCCTLDRMKNIAVHKRRDSYTPYVAGDYSPDGLMEVVSVERLNRPYVYRRVERDTVRVLVRMEAGIGWKISYARPMQDMALHCVEPYDVILACGANMRFYKERCWYREFDVKVLS